MKILIYSVLVVSCFLVPEVVFAVPTSSSLLSTTSTSIGVVYNNGSFLMSTSSLYIHSNKNVGIGTLNPLAPLHVYSGDTAQSRLSGFLFSRSDTVNTTHLQHYYAGIHYLSQNLFRETPSGVWSTDNTGNPSTAIIQDTRLGQGYIAFYVEAPHSSPPTFYPTERMRIDVNGNLGIGTTSPSQRLSVAGSVLADSYLEYSPVFVGDALSEIRKIDATVDSKQKSNSKWLDVDHDLLPEGVRYEKQIIHPAVYATTTKEYYNENYGTSTEIVWDYKKLLVATSTELFVGRDMGKQVQFNLRAIQQLLDRLEILENKVKELELKK